MPIHLDPRRVSAVLRVSGATAVATSLIALILGLVLVESTANDFRATVGVSGSAVDAILETVDVVSAATREIKEGVDAAASGVGEVSATAIVGAANIEDVANFLDQDLPDNLEAIREAMPAAIQAAGAIDGTLRALSFVGVDYSPSEPFDDSLRTVEDALRGLPDDLRDQAESLRELVPVAADLAGEADRLSLALIRLGEDLEGIEEITNAYVATLSEASFAIEQTESNLDRNIWLIRAAILILAVGGGAVGVGLYAAGSFVDTISNEADADLVSSEASTF